MGIEGDTGVWSLEWDVIVVGSGGCGLTAGIAAAQGGAEVVVLEKQERPWSNTSRSSGMIPAAGTRFQREAGIIETPEHMAEDIFRKNKYTSDPELTLHLCRTAPRLVEWLVDEIGVHLAFVSDFKYPGMSQFRMHAPPSRTGADLAADLQQALKRYSGAVLVQGATATGLVVDGDGVVCGALVERGEKSERIKAKKVILACNGFGANPARVRE
jgi:fumarate reductase flavoprotein subunit